MELLAAMMAHIQNGLVDVCMLVIVSNSREVNAEPFGSCALAWTAMQSLPPSGARCRQNLTIGSQCKETHFQRMSRGA
jgi:hypothetical protein